MNNNIPWITFVLGIIKTYHLDFTINSLLRQTPCFEVIVIDDRGCGSEIKCLNNISDRCSIVVNQKNLGASCPAIVWNQGLAMARGDFVCVLGDDDYLDDGWVEGIRVAHDSRPKCSVIRSRLRMIDDKGGTIRLTQKPPLWEPWWELLYDRNMHNRTMSLGEHVFHTQSLRNMGGFPELPLAWGSDDMAVIRASCQSGIVATTDVCYNWRVHPKSISGSEMNLQKMFALQKLLQWEQSLLPMSPDLQWEELVSMAINNREQSIIQEMARIINERRRLVKIRRWIGKKFRSILY